MHGLLKFVSPSFIMTPSAGLFVRIKESLRKTTLRLSTSLLGGVIYALLAMLLHMFSLHILETRGLEFNSYALKRVSG
jgi:hypothetical protein